EARVHHLVLGAGRHHAGSRWLGAVLVAHEHHDFRADRALIELDRLFAAAVEEQIRLDLHDISLVFFDRFWELPLRGDLRALTFFLLPKLRRELRTKVFGFEHLANLDLGIFA